MKFRIITILQAMGEGERAQCEMENAKAASMDPDEIKQYLTSDEIKRLFKALDSIEKYELVAKEAGEELGKIRELLNSSLPLEKKRQLMPLLGEIQSRVYPVERAADEARKDAKRLLKMAEDKKEEAAREAEARKEKTEVEAEARKKEAERAAKIKEIREMALKEINPPYKDARRYLSEEEYKEFQQSIPKAIDYHIQGDEYFSYTFLVNKIKDKKRDDLEKQQARFEAEQYLRELNDSIANFKATLFSEKKDVDSYFSKDISYCTLQFPQGKGQAYRNIIKEKIQAGIPENLRSNLTFKLLRIFYRSFPYAEYMLIDKVPSLNFNVRLYIVPEIEYRLKQSQIYFGFYTFNVPNTKDTGFLGYGYRLFTPDELDAAGYYFWQTIPCVLIQGLLQGNIEPQSTRITEVTESSTSYEINGFDEEISIPDTFSKYLKAIGSWQGLMEKGIISSKVGEVVARAMERSTKELPSPETPKLSKGTKKARVFQLFNEGKRPGDPTVKSLGIKPETAYRYYQDWKKIQHSSQNAT